MKRMSQNAKVCQCCGAPIHGYKCDYCGVEYEKPSDYIPPVVIYKENADVRTLATKTHISLRHIDYMGIYEAERQVKQMMAKQMSDELVNYMDYETWIDPTTREQVFGGRLKVVMPKGGY